MKLQYQASKGSRIKTGAGGLVFTQVDPIPRKLKTELMGRRGNSFLWVEIAAKKSPVPDLARKYLWSVKKKRWIHEQDREKGEECSSSFQTYSGGIDSIRAFRKALANWRKYLPESMKGTVFMLVCRIANKNVYGKI